jgi:nucleotide-binding universal stress UspA family protein
MYQSILVPLDGSKRAERILPHITELARKFASEVMLMQVVEPHIEFSGTQVKRQAAAVADFREETQQAEVYLSELEANLQARGVSAHWQVAHGEPIKAILSQAHGVHADLIAMSSHGRSGFGRAFYGSVSAGLLQHVDRPLLLVRAEGEDEEPPKTNMYNTILVPLDGSPRAESILPYVEELALKFKAEVVVLQVVDTDLILSSPYGLYGEMIIEQVDVGRITQEAEAYLEKICRRLISSGVHSRSLIGESPVVRRIIATAEAENADLIAMASHGRTGLAGVFYGSVAAGVLHQVDRPLLLIRSNSET